MKLGLQILVWGTYGLLLVLIIFTLKEKKEEEVHPLEEEWAEIQNEFYRYYLTEKKIPEDLEFLSEKSKQIISIYQEQFEWNEDSRTLKIRYLKPANGFLGSEISPELIEHNSQIHKDAGRLN